jgi:8-oxo-dGTP pyrophosphatase MutT (NUDIX family)
MDWARTGRVDADAVARIPVWLRPVADIAESVTAHELTRWVPPHGEGRHSAVLILFSDDRDLLLIQRASTMRSHAGQPAFPGGAVDAEDADAVGAALREAREETGLDSDGVVVFGALPDLWVPVTNFVVTPVLGWWQRPSPVTVGDPAEVESVHRVTIDEFIDPANRCRVLHPSGFVGPAFEVQGLLVWGFTAGLISGLLDRLGWARPWDESRIVPLEPDFAEETGA